MFSGLLQDWTTIDGADTSPFSQARPDWLDLARFADVVFWLEVRAVQKPGAGDVTLTYETSPAVEESLFQPLAAVTLVVSSTPVISQIKLASSPLVPLARFVRWKLAGTAAGNWSVTFRIHTMANKGSAGGVPASLALGGWWRGSYAGTPWVGVASAGSSEGRTLVDGITPGTGAALNGFDTAQFNGTSQYFASTIDAGALFTSAAGSIAVLYYAQTAPAPGPNPYDDPALLGLYFWGTLSLAVNSTGVRAGIFGVDSVLYEATATTSTGAWHLAQMRWNTVNLEVRVDGGAWQTSSSGGGANGEIFGASAAQVGTDYVRAVFFDGLIVEILAAPVTLDDATFDNIKGYCNARYALSL